MTTSPLNLTTTDLIQLFGQAWEAPAPKALLLLVHGMGEHSARYGHWAERFVQKGYSVAAIDLRGHGRSAGKRGHAPSMAQLLDDLEAFERLALQRWPGLPLAWYGHSLGGNLVANLLLRRKTAASRAILTSPWFELAFQPPKAKLLLARMAYKAFPAFAQPSGLDTRQLSRDPEEVRKYVQDPLIHDRITPRLFLDAFEAGRWAARNAHLLPCPVFLAHGQGDAITAHAASQAFASANPGRVRFSSWPGAFHELHHEPEREDLFREIIRWLDQAPGR